MRASAVALLALALPCAGREEQRFPIQDTSVVVTVDSPWPRSLNKGWLPVFVRVENGEELAQRVRIQGTCWGPEREIETVLTVGPGASDSVELLVPVFEGSPNSVSLRVELDRTTQFLGSDWGAPEYAGSETRAVLVLGADAPPAGTSERWTAEVSDRVSGPEGGGLILRGIRVLSATGYPGSGSPTPSSGTPANNIRVAAIPFLRMPARSAAYTSLDVVILDTTGGLPEARLLEPLLAWTRLGGSLVLAGESPEEVARGVPELASWMEARFGRDQGVIDGKGGSVPVRGWRCGLGAVYALDGAPLESPLQRELVRKLVNSGERIVDGPDASRMQDTPPAIPELFTLPLKSFSVFLILFAVVIGPVNFILVRRGRRPAVLLITIPAIALAASILLLGYGLVSQGLGVKISSQTLGVLDQRSHRVQSAETRMIFAGLSPGPGLVPGPGTTCLPVFSFESAGGTVMADDSSRTYRVRQTDGLLLSGQFMPSRTAFVQQVCSDRAERARLGVSRSGAAFTVENGLGASIRALVLRAPDGGYHRLSEPLAAGASAPLEPVLDGPERLREALARQRKLAPGLDGLPPATYVAELERNPFGDDCGVSGEEVAGGHALFGVLDPASEEWR